jgi:hypothetical protein
MNLSTFTSPIGSGSVFKEPPKVKTVQLVTVTSPPPIIQPLAPPIKVMGPVKTDFLIPLSRVDEVKQDHYFEIKKDNKRIKAQGIQWTGPMGTPQPVPDYRIPLPEPVRKQTPNIAPQFLQSMIGLSPPPMVVPIMPPRQIPQQHDKPQLMPRMPMTIEPKPFDYVPPDPVLSTSQEDFIQQKFLEGPPICSNINCKQFSVLLREGLTSGMSSRIYLQKGLHTFWIPVTFVVPPTNPQLIIFNVQCIHQGKVIKSWQFPVGRDNNGFVVQIELDFEEKWYLQKRLYHIEFICEDLKVTSPEFSIVNFQQFTKTKKRKFTVSKWCFLGIHPSKGSSKGGDFIALYFSDPFQNSDRIFVDQIEVKSLFSGFNVTSQCPTARYVSIIETPAHVVAKDILITVNSGRNQYSHTFSFE